MRASTLPSPNACRWCDIDRETHLQRWAIGVMWHLWVEPTDEQRKARMLAAREARLASLEDLASARRWRAGGGR